MFHVSVQSEGKGVVFEQEAPGVIVILVHEDGRVGASSGGLTPQGEIAVLETALDLAYAHEKSS